ncbi:MAG TPA: metal-dependent hydrolase [Thermomicrobiales bacterium]|jgi:inner membrane protein
MSLPLHPLRLHPWRLALPGLALIVVADDLLVRHAPSRVIAAVLDESAHLATAYLFSSLFSISGRLPFFLGTLAGAVLLDADHLPGEFGWDIITRGSGRPVPHSLPTVGLLLLAALPLQGHRRDLVAGAAFGVGTHLVRDMATGGVPLRWPRDKRRVRIPYALYLALLTVAGVNVAKGAGRVAR